MKNQELNYRWQVWEMLKEPNEIIRGNEEQLWWNVSRETGRNSK